MNARRVARSLRAIAAEFSALADELSPPDVQELDDEALHEGLYGLRSIQLEAILARALNSHQRPPRA